MKSNWSQSSYRKGIDGISLGVGGSFSETSCFSWESYSHVAGSLFHKLLAEDSRVALELKGAWRKLEEAGRASGSLD